MGDPTHALFFAAQGISLGVYNASFNLSHYMIADKYYEICKRVPIMLNGLQETAPTLFSKVMFWVLCTLNVCGGLAVGVFYGLDNMCEDAHVEFFCSPVPDGDNEIKSKAYIDPGRTWGGYTSNACAFISGFILIAAVFKIRKFFRERDATEFIDTAMMVRHGLAFGLYVLGYLLAVSTEAVFFA